MKGHTAVPGLERAITLSPKGPSKEIAEKLLVLGDQDCNRNLWATSGFHDNRPRQFTRWAGNGWANSQPEVRHGLIPYHQRFNPS